LSDSCSSNSFGQFSKISDCYKAPAPQLPVAWMTPNGSNQ
jgi:hypothetical protein